MFISKFTRVLKYKKSWKKFKKKKNFYLQRFRYFAARPPIQLLLVPLIQLLHTPQSHYLLSYHIFTLSILSYHYLHHLITYFIERSINAYFLIQYRNYENCWDIKFRWIRKIKWFKWLRFDWNYSVKLEISFPTRHLPQKYMCVCS